MGETKTNTKEINVDAIIEKIKSLNAPDSSFDSLLEVIKKETEERTIKKQSLLKNWDLSKDEERLNPKNKLYKRKSETPSNLKIPRHSLSNESLMDSKTTLKEKFIRKGLKHKEFIKKIPIVNITARSIYHNFREDPQKNSIVGSGSYVPLNRKIKVFIKKIPIFGSFLWWIYMILKAPVKLNDLKEKEEELNSKIGHLSSELQEKQQAALGKINELAADAAEKQAALGKINELAADAMEKQQAALGKINGLAAEVTGIKDFSNDILVQIKDYNANISIIHENFLSLIKEANKRLPEGTLSNDDLKTILNEEDHMLDAMYALFEDRFRGSREDIKGRLAYYLPYIKYKKSGAKNPQILDIGCGRGEWLELLRENGYKAKGIDLNRVMIMRCRDLELDVEECDVIEYLSKQKSNSLNVITGFHIAEHLTFKKLITLLHEALRILKEEGVLILETPNPENIIVGACNFYIDPTHQKPIPPNTLKFLYDTVGFVDTKIHAPEMNLFDEDKVLHKLFGAWGSKYPDYSILGYKP